MSSMYLISVIHTHGMSSILIGRDFLYLIISMIIFITAQKILTLHTSGWAWDWSNNTLFISITPSLKNSNRTEYVMKMARQSNSHGDAMNKCACNGFMFIYIYVSPC